MVIQQRTIQKKVLEKLISFAKANPKVEALYKGVNLETSETVYYFLYPGKADFEFTDKLTDLSIRILTNHKLKLYTDVSLMRWPISKKQADSYGFLESCLYSNKEHEPARI